MIVITIFHTEDAFDRHQPFGLELELETGNVDEDEGRESKENEDKVGVKDKVENEDKGLDKDKC